MSVSCWRCPQAVVAKRLGSDGVGLSLTCCLSLYPSFLATTLPLLLLFLFMQDYSLVFLELLLLQCPTFLPIIPFTLTLFCFICWRWHSLHLFSKLCCRVWVTRYVSLLGMLVPPSTSCISRSSRYHLLVSHSYHP